MTDDDESFYENQNLAVLTTDSFWLVNKNLAKVLTPNSVLFLSVLMDKFRLHKEQGTLPEDKFLYETEEAMKSKIGLLRHNQEICIKTLKEQLLIFMETKGLPPRRHFKLRQKNINRVLLTGESLITGETADSNYGTFRRDSTNLNNPDTYKEKDENAIRGTSTERTVGKQRQVKTNIENKVSVNCPSDNKQNPTELGFSNLHPRKLIQRRTKPVPVKEESFVGCDPVIKKSPIFAKRKNISCPKVTSEISEILEHWKSKQFKRKIPSEETNSYAMLIMDLSSLLEGTLFSGYRDQKVIKKYMVEEVKRSIDNFALSAYDKDHEPLSLRQKQFLASISVGDFFYNRREGDETKKSRFLQYLYKPKLVSSNSSFLVKDDLPAVTNRLDVWFKSTFSNVGLDGNYKRSDLIYTSKAIKAFYDDNKAKLKDMEDHYGSAGVYEPINFLAKQLTQMFDKMLRENSDLYTKISTNWLKSDKTMTDRLPSFLREKHIMS